MLGKHTEISYVDTLKLIYSPFAFEVNFRPSVVKLV